METIKQVRNGDAVIINTTDENLGEVCEKNENPTTQVRGYVYKMRNKIRQKTGKTPLVYGMTCGIFLLHWLDAVCTPSLQSASAFGWCLGWNLFERKDFGLFCEVLAAIGVESKPIKEESILPFSTRKSTCDFMIRERRA